MFKELKFINVRFKGGGGGGGSGAVDYPDYMKTWHGDALNDGGADTLTSSVTDVINAALGNSPFTGLNAYDPDNDITNMLASADDMQTLVDLLSNGTTLDTLIADILDTTRIDNMVTAYANDLDDRLIATILPRFEAGMRDINAVVSSAFVIGRALIEEEEDRQVAKYGGALYLKGASDDAIKVIGMKLEYQKVVSQLIVDTYRLKIVAKKEEVDENMKIDENDALWDLSLFQYGSNVLGAIGGGTVSPRAKEPSTAQSVLGGALSGAAAGAMVGGPYGAVIGGVLGAAAGLLG